MGRGECPDRLIILDKLLALWVLMNLYEPSQSPFIIEHSMMLLHIREAPVVRELG